VLRRARLDRGVDVVERREEVLERGFIVDGVEASLRAVDEDGDGVFEHVVIRAGERRVVVDVVKWRLGSSVDIAVEVKLGQDYWAPRLFLKLEGPDLELFTRERLERIRTLEDLEAYLEELGALAAKAINIVGREYSDEEDSDLEL
jgi:hypothetical protein